jgi:hypothetical protein
MGLLSSWSARAKGVLEVTERESEPPEHGGAGGGDPVTERMRWCDICRVDEFRGRWVALDDCHYDEATGKATEGAVVDVDDDLVELCSRIRASDRKNCAILFCDEAAETH